VQSEHREVRCRRPDGGVVVGVQVFEEAAHLPGPAVEVGGQDGGLVGVGHLLGADGFDAAADPQLTLAGGPQVADPLGVAPGRHEVALAVELEQVDHGRAPLAARPAPHGEDPGAGHGDAVPHEPADRPVEALVVAAGGQVAAGVGRRHPGLLGEQRSLL